MDKKLKVVVGDKSLELSYDALNPSYDFETVVDEAIAYGKDKGIFAKKEYLAKHKA